MNEKTKEAYGRFLVDVFEKEFSEDIAKLDAERSSNKIISEILESSLDVLSEGVHVDIDGGKTENDKNAEKEMEVD